MHILNEQSSSWTRAHGSAQPRQQATLRRLDEARARRVARRLEDRCRLRTPDCSVSAVLDGDSRTVELTIGAAGAAAADRLRVLDLDAAAVPSTEAMDRLAAVARVWLEPDLASTALPQAAKSSRRRGVEPQPVWSRSGR